MSQIDFPEQTPNRPDVPTGAAESHPLLPFGWMLIARVTTAPSRVAGVAAVMVAIGIAFLTPREALRSTTSPPSLPKGARIYDTAVAARQAVIMLEDVGGATEIRTLMRRHKPAGR